MMRWFSGRRAASKRLSAAATSGSARKRLGQRRGIVRRLRDAGRHMRARDEGRIADDRDPAERHARRFEIVDRLQDRLLDQPHDLAELRRQQPLGIGAHFGDRLAADQRRRDRNRVRDAALVGEQPWQLRLLVGRPVPDHVVAAMAGAQIVVRPRHRIAEKLLARRQRERHVFEQFAMDVRRKIALRDQRAPGAVAGIERHDLGQRLLAHRRADAVGADQQIGLDRLAIGKMRQHRRRRRCSKPGKPAAAVIALRRKSVAQQPVDPLPGGEHLRAIELARSAGPRASRILRVVMSTPSASVASPSAAQPLDQFVLRDDAGAAAGQFAVHPLVDIDGPPGAAQQQPAEQAAHRAADDNRAASPGQWHALAIFPLTAICYI